MIFHASITTTANTAKTAPKKTDIKALKGLIYKIGIYFPPGSTGLMGVQIFDANYQMYPTTTDEWIIGDNLLYEFDDTYFKNAEPWNFTIHTYNLDTAYEHKIFIMIAMVSQKVFIARYIPSEQYELMKKIFKEIAQEQAEIKRRIIKRPFNIGTAQGLKNGRNGVS